MIFAPLMAAAVAAKALSPGWSTATASASFDPKGLYSSVGQSFTVSEPVKLPPAAKEDLKAFCAGVTFVVRQRTPAFAAEGGFNVVAFTDQGTLTCGKDGHNTREPKK